MKAQTNTDSATSPASMPNTAQAAARQPYEPPKATFVPLKLEERLLKCGKVNNSSACAPQSGS